MDPLARPQPRVFGPQAEGIRHVRRSTLFETELKFQVPPARRAALLKAMSTATAVTIRLQAMYADTADRRLAAAGLALRLRKEGRHWVQTLKGRGEGPLQRLEHEVRLPASVGRPALDAFRHAGTPAGDRLLALLADGADLIPLYGTDIRRLRRQVRFEGAVVELAYDRGHIFADQRRLAVDELELELVRGPSSALVALARRWAQRHELWWDVRSKAERGHRLALAVDQVPAVKAPAFTLPAGTTPGQAFALWLQQALMQALPNASEIADGSSGPEHLHQLRVALRRLRATLRVFAPWANDPVEAAALELAWREPFALLGVVRDQDVMAQSLLPALAAAGAPTLAPMAVPAPMAPAQVVCAPEFADLMLRTLTLIVTPPGLDAPLSPQPLQDLKAAVQEQLNPLGRQVRKGAARFAQASPSEQHRLRKRIKRLRYVLEGAQSLFKRRATQSCLRGLRQALQALGELHDQQVAQALYRDRAAQDPQAWFAVGYLAGREIGLHADAVQALANLKDSPPPWRKAS